MNLVYLEDDFTSSLTRFETFLDFFSKELDVKTIVAFKVSQAIQKNYLKSIQKFYKSNIIFSEKEILQLQRFLITNVNNPVKVIQQIKNSKEKIIFIPCILDNEIEKNINPLDLVVSLISIFYSSRSNALDIWSYNKKILTTNSDHNSKINGVLPIPAITYRELMELSQYNSIFPINWLNALFSKKVNVTLKTYRGNSCTKIVSDKPIKFKKSKQNERLITALSVYSRGCFFCKIENFELSRF